MLQPFKKRKGRSVAHAPEPEVDSNGRHLDIAGAGVESIRRRAEGRDYAGRNCEASAAKTEIIILGSEGPIIGKGPFKAAAYQPAADGAAISRSCRKSSCDVGDGKAVGTDPTAAALGVDHPAVKSVTQTTRYGRHPSVIGAGGKQVAERSDNCDGVIVVVHRPVEIPLDAEDDTTDLIIKPNLTAGHEDGTVAVVEVQAEVAVGDIGVGPGPAQIAADIEAGPAERRWQRRRLQGHLHISRVCADRGSQQNRQSRDRMK
jgi:hypothetical protein